MIELPATFFKGEHFVYHLCYKGVVIYVGESKSLTNRINVHRQNGKIFDSVRALPCKRADALMIEQAHIIEHKPILNKKDSVCKSICLELGNYLFVRYFGRAFEMRVNDIHLYDHWGNRVGFLNDGNIFYVGLTYVVWYDLTTGEATHKVHESACDNYEKWWAKYDEQTLKILYEL